MKAAKSVLLSTIVYIIVIIVLFCFVFSSGSGEEADLPELSIITNLPSSPIKGPKSPVKPPKSPTKAGLKKISFSTSKSKSQRVYQSGLRTLYTSGRPPWYDSHGSLKEPFVIGKYLLSIGYIYHNVVI